MVAITIMNFLRLRDGLLLLNVDAIACIELLSLDPTNAAIHISLSGGKTFALYGEDAKAVLIAIGHRQIEAIAAAESVPDIAAALRVPAGTVTSDLQAVSYQKAAKRSGKNK